MSSAQTVHIELGVNLVLTPASPTGTFHPMMCWTGDRNAETYVYGFLDSSNIHFSSACHGPGGKGGPRRQSFSIPLLVSTVKGDL